MSNSETITLPSLIKWILIQIVTHGANLPFGHVSIRSLFQIKPPLQK